MKYLFAGDDFTFVNLECALTDADTPADKTYRFRGLPAYGQILTEGSVEGVTLANNHSLDYGTEGLADTPGRCLRNWELPPAVTERRSSTPRTVV